MWPHYTSYTPQHILSHTTTLHFTSHIIPHHTTTSDLAPPHLTSHRICIKLHSAWHHSTPPLCISHIAYHSCISHHTATFHITPPHQFPYLTPYSTPDLNCNISQCTTSYYTTFELHHSASCAIPHHDHMSQHSVFHITAHGHIPHRTTTTLFYTA